MRLQIKEVGFLNSDEEEDEVLARVVSLRQHFKKVEHRTPLLAYKTNNEMSQIKRFILIYFEPLLTKVDKQQLRERLSTAEKQNPQP